MVTRQQVEELLAEMESDRIERTISVREEKLGPAVCALSNDYPNHKKPGYILLGVNDDGSIAGKAWTDEDLQKIGGIKSNGNVLPQPSIIVSEVFKFTEGEVVVIEVKPSAYPPVRYDGRCWIRTGARKSKASPEEERILIERRASHSKTYDLAPASDSSLTDLNINAFNNNYLPLAIDRDTLAEDGRPIEEQLASLRFYDIKQKCPTHAGMLVFGFHPLYFLPGAYIQYVKFAANDRTGTVLFEKEFSGPIITLLPIIDDFIKANIIKQRPVRTASFRETTQTNYPYWALRELVMNAIMHRSYESNAPIYIYEFADSIQIINPGGLFGDVNAHNFPNASDYRNVVIAEAMKILGYVNRFNYGVARATDELTKNGNPAPDFDLNLLTKFQVKVACPVDWIRNDADDLEISGPINDSGGPINDHSGPINDLGGPINGPIKTPVRNAKARKDIEGNIANVIKLITEKPGISLADIAIALHRPATTVKKYIKRLRDLKSIEFKGARKTGGYFLTDAKKLSEKKNS